MMYAASLPKIAVLLAAMEIVRKTMRDPEQKEEIKEIEEKTKLVRKKAEQQQNIKNYILVNSEHKVHRVNYADILYIQSMREYVAFYLPDKRILSLKSLKKLETELPSDQFIRIHKSYIISKNKVKALEGNLVHIGKEKIPIGASYRDAVMAKLF